MIKKLLTVSAIALSCNSMAGEVLDRINATGNVNIGSRPASVPYSYTDTGKRGFGRYIGYQQDVCQVIYRNIEKNLGKSLSATKINVDGTTRFSFLNAGNIDFECSAAVMTQDRLDKGFLFSITSVDPIVVAGLKTATPKSVEDLKGKRVAVAKGTTAVKALGELNKKGYSITVIQANDYTEGFMMVDQGRADFVGANELLLGGNIGIMVPEQSNKFKVYSNVVIGDPELVGVMFKKGDKELEDIIRSTVQSMKNDGSLDKLYEKWFVGPIAPHNNQLNLPRTKEKRNLVWSNK